jgi:chromosomal replication initiation ATPase DnaA
MYLIRQLCDRSLKEIAALFPLGSYGSVGKTCGMIELQLKLDRTLRRRIEQIREMGRSTSIQKEICPSL